MKVLVINCGSSSLKYKLLDMKREKVMVRGIAERIGLNNGCYIHEVGHKKYKIEMDIANHEKALDRLIELLTDDVMGCISNLNEIKAIGHRVVHGGEVYSSAVIIDEHVIKVIESCSKIAPLHNPANSLGIQICQKRMPNIPMVAVFDTAFHQTIPKKAYIYPIKYELYEKYHIRRYGFHGISHHYMIKKLDELLEKSTENLNVISCHLGNGSSLAAIKQGRCVDTTMGFTPLAGIPMGTRSGSIDPSIVSYLIRNCGYTIEEIDTLLNKESGILGISEVSSDFREIEKAASEGNKRAQLAMEVFCYYVKKYIGAYTAIMGGVDVIVFTAGIGEHSAATRKMCLEGLDFLGITVDNRLNQLQLGEISVKESAVKLFVIPTDEELMIARQTQAVLT